MAFSSSSPASNYFMQSITIFCTNIFHALVGRKLRKAYGLDGVLPIVFQNCASMLKPHLSTFTIHSCWKLVYIQRVPKKGDRLIPLCYHIITLISGPSNFFFNILNWKILNPRSVQKGFPSAALGV